MVMSLMRMFKVGLEVFLKGLLMVLLMMYVLCVLDFLLLYIFSFSMYFLELF